MPNTRRKVLPYYRIQRIDEALMVNAMTLRILNNVVIMKLSSEEMLRAIAQAIDLVHQNDRALMLAKGQAGERSEEES